MDQKLTIPKTIKLTQASDFNWLRQEGVKYAEALSHKVWTDYNVHDPGITILEVLSWALTEGGYKLGFGMSDILAREPGKGKNDFYTAKKILTNNPTTILDLRKYCIDIDGIQNAWFYKHYYPLDDTPASTCVYDFPDPVTGSNTVCKYKGEYYTDPDTNETLVCKPDFFYKCQPDSKDYDIKFTDAGGYLPKRLNGLYNVMLQLEEDEEFGDMNANVIPWIVSSGGTDYNLKIAFPVVEVQFPSWDYPIASILDYNNVTGVSATIAPGGSNIRTIQNLTFTFDGNAAKTIVFTNLKLVIETTGTLSNTVIKNELENMAAGQIAFGPWVTRRLQRILSLVKKVYCALHKVRNLCEDYVKFSIVKQQEILLCADIGVEPSADLETILAEIYFRIDTFLAPPVRFYNMLEMYEKGYRTEDIFNGYVLNHGFIAEDELSLSDLKTEVHTSDLYNIIMSVPGVISVKHLQITNYLDGVPMTPGELWCLKLNGAYSLNLSKESTKKIHFYKNELMFFADGEQAELLIKTLKAEHSKPKIINAVNDLPVPEGTYRYLNEYSSVQNDFPEVYKTGRNGIASSDKPERVAQVKQLKAFLLFFDQMLVNFFGQMNLAKDLLSMDVSINPSSTYAGLPVYDKPGEGGLPDFYHVQNLIHDFTKTLSVVTDLDNEQSYKVAWDAFAGYNNNSFMIHLREITESQETFYKRRNLFLDHLIARFAENFNEYTIITHKMFKPVTDEDLINSFTIINIGVNTFGFEYRISGVKVLENMATIIGLDKCKSVIRQVILNGMTYDNYLVDPSNAFRFVLKDINGIDIAKHITPSLNQQAAEAIIFNIIKNLSALWHKEQVDLVEDKKLFLGDYPRLSSERGKAFIYKCCGSQSIAPGWPLENISGLQRRVARLLGINNPADRMLLPAERDFSKVNVGVTTRKFRFRKNGTGPFLLENPAPNFTDDEYLDKIFNVIESGAFRERYVNAGVNSFELRDKKGNVLAVPIPVFAAPADRDNFINDLVNYFKNEYYQEGFHLIEHILLRPVKEGLITVNDVKEGYYGLCLLNEDCDCPITDHYSFRITIALPYWPDRFRNMSYRAYTEKIIRYETPAHILAKICWIDFKDMLELEKLYLEWRNLMCQFKPNRTDLHNAIRDLVKKINNMKNIYPEGVLHDCEHPSEDEAIVLNQSALGTFDDEENDS
jgi:hypothetical protein